MEFEPRLGGFIAMPSAHNGAEGTSVGIESQLSALNVIPDNSTSVDDESTYPSRFLPSSVTF